MANSYPTWSPNAGERFGNWIGVAIGTFVFWDKYEEAEDEVKTSLDFPAKANGQDIDSDCRSVFVESESTAHYVNLPSISDFGEGNTLFLQAGSKGFRVRCKTTDYEASINGSQCSSDNELFVPAKSLVQFLAVGKKEWKALAYTEDGIPLPASPRTRSLTRVVKEYGYQELVAMDPTDIYTSYDGTDDYFLLDPHSAPINTSTLFSVAAWVYSANSAAALETIVANWNSTSNQRSWALFTYNNKFRFYASYDGSSTDFFETTGTFTDNTWTHVAVTYNAGSVKIYIDNAAAETDTLTQVTLYNTNAELCIGTYDSGAVGDYAGRIAHLVMEGVEWSSGTVSNIYNSAPPSTAHYFPFGNGTNKRQHLDAMTKTGTPTTVSTISSTVDSNCKRAFIFAENSRQISLAPQLRPGQECVIRTDTSHKMIFPNSVVGVGIVANETLVSDWKGVMTLTAEYDYHLKALNSGHYQVIRVYKDGDPSSTPSFT